MYFDDSPADNFYHKYIISNTGVANRIEVTHGGQEALTYLTKASEPQNAETFPKPDMIFLDINMPRMNGFEFLEEYNNLDKNLKSKVIVIMLTTSLNPDDRDKALRASEVKEFVNKPLSDELILEIVNKYF